MCLSDPYLAFIISMEYFCHISSTFKTLELSKQAEKIRNDENWHFKALSIEKCLAVSRKLRLIVETDQSINTELN